MIRPTSAYALELRFSEAPDLLLRDVTALLYDLELSHDFAVLLTDDSYKTYEFSRFFWLRNGRPLRPDHRIRAGRISHHSPFLTEIVVPTIAGTWGLIQIAAAIDNWKLAREKLELEVRKLRREEENLKRSVRDAYVGELADRIKGKGERNIHEQLLGRLRASPLQLENAAVTYRDLDQEPANDGKPKV